MKWDPPSFTESSTEAPLKSLETRALVIKSLETNIRRNVADYFVIKAKKIYFRDALVSLFQKCQPCQISWVVCLHAAPMLLCFILTLYVASSGRIMQVVREPY